jgi:RND family efflux transporter MFP subunit
MRARALLVCCASLWLGACEQQSPPAAQVRPVRAVKVEHRIISEPLVMVGQIKPQDEVNIAFRADGRLIDRPVNLGDRIAVGNIVARIESRTEQNAVEGAEADVAAAQANLAQVEKAEARQSDLLKRGVTSRASYDQALQQLQAAQAQLDGASSRLRTSQSRAKYAELDADVGGTVTAVGATPGEFVRAGQMIVRVAREDRKDAAFDVPAQLALSGRIQALGSLIVQVALIDNPSIKTTGHIREISPQADPATRLFPVKIGLDDPPAEFFLGVTVTGRVSLDSSPVLAVPLTAVIEWDGGPSVWVVDPTSNTVAQRAVEIMRYDSSVVIVSKGLRDGDVVVTAGVNILHPGQRVKLLPGTP